MGRSAVRQVADVPGRTRNVRGFPESTGKPRVTLESRLRAGLPHGSAGRRLRMSYLFSQVKEVQMSDHGSGQVREGDESHDAGSDLAFGMAIMKGSAIGLPLMIVFMTVAVWMMTGQSWQTSIATALLPGVLFGVFGGGFLGMLRAMNH